MFIFLTHKKNPHTGRSGFPFQPVSNTNSPNNHKCVSLFAKCNCNGGLENDAKEKAKLMNAHALRRKTFFQSYSHPDTAYVFTDDNKTPISRNERVQISRAKRMSTPNIGNNYTVLDVAVHPEVVLTVSHKNGSIIPRYVETVRSKPKPILKKSITFQSDSDGSPVYEEIMQKSDSAKAIKLQSNANAVFDSAMTARTESYLRSDRVKKLSLMSASQTYGSAQNLEYLKNNALSYQQINNDNVNNNKNTNNNSNLESNLSDRKYYHKEMENIAAYADLEKTTSSSLPDYLYVNNAFIDENVN